MKPWQISALGGVLAVISAIAGFQVQQYLNSKDRQVDNKSQQAQVYKKPLTPEEVIGMKVEDFSLSDVNNIPRSFSEWQGKVVVINFWATWCPPCRDEIPAFIELQHQYSNKGLQFIGIALQEADEIRDFINEFRVNYPSLVGSDDVINIASKLGNEIGALPYTVVIDRNGNISFTRRGPLSKSEAESAITALL